MNDSESAEVRETDREPAVENPYASGQAEPGANRRKKGKGCLIAAGVILGVLFVVGETAPSLQTMKYKADQVVAMNNGKSMMLALGDFAAEYGSFPDRETAKAVRQNTHTTLDIDGDSANAYFRQLLATGMAKSENPFYAKSPYSPRHPDNQFKTSGQALAPGEVGFGYLMDGNKAMDASDDDRIIAVTPLLNATATGEFDAEPLRNKAAVVYVDSSVRMMPIDPNTRQIRVHGRQTLLETGEGTIWGNTIHPVIKPPLTPPGWQPVAQGKTWTVLAWLLCIAAVIVVIALWAALRKKRRRAT